MARRLFLDGQGLLEDPARKATPAKVRVLVESLGFVQVDSINMVERAHHLTLGTRLDGYRPPMLARLLERDRTLFENWTHDASIIPTRWFPQWGPIFAQAGERIPNNAWWRERLGGDPATVLKETLERVRAHGPISSRSFEKGEKAGNQAWWGWKPGKAALEHLWRTGQISVVQRVASFEKIYDLTERVLPDAHAAPHPTAEEHLAWAMETAIARLGIATPTELAAFWRAVPIAAARGWCIEAKKRGQVVEVTVEGRPYYADPRWNRRLPEAPARMRLLSPFDPIIRDRKRALRLFDFDYRFEAFVPEPKREYGYYVMPVLDGERLIARVDPKYHRDRGALVIRKIWWERGVKPRKRPLREAIERLATQIGATTVEASI